MRDAEDRERFAIRREEGAMAAEERLMERELEALEEDIEGVERTIDEDLRQEHYGREPEHLPFWNTGHPGLASPERRGEGGPTEPADDTPGSEAPPPDGRETA